ncbi:hypothetical protein CDAR_248691 [Caerostris darwini]|uniref:Uncharacterized protein n=1 Tax=Caerostris darwini TaxID=1538125 RepID=A0AAV4MRF1_9ARAC|nr:hypothetical protein CDAR_248691 [Caerostris darwini]
MSKPIDDTTLKKIFNFLLLAIHGYRKLVFLKDLEKADTPVVSFDDHSLLVFGRLPNSLQTSGAIGKGRGKEA